MSSARYFAAAKNSFIGRGAPRDASMLGKRVARLRQLLELGVLLRQPIRYPFFVALAGRGGGLLDQLPDIVAGDRDAVFEFCERQGAVIGHIRSSRDGRLRW